MSYRVFRALGSTRPVPSPVVIFALLASFMKLHDGENDDGHSQRYHHVAHHRHHPHRRLLVLLRHLLLITIIFIVSICLIVTAITIALASLSCSPPSQDHLRCLSRKHHRHHHRRHHATFNRTVAAIVSVIAIIMMSILRSTIILVRRIPVMISKVDQFGFS